MQIGWSDADIQVAKWDRERLLADCQRQNVVAGLLTKSVASPSQSKTMRQRVGHLLLQVRDHLQSVQAIPRGSGGTAVAGERGAIA